MTDKALLTAPPQPPEPKPDLIARVARASGVSPLKQFVEQLRLSYGANKITFNDYYNYRLYDPALSKADKRAFVGQAGNRALNLAMTPAERTPSLTLLERKVPSEAHFRAQGLRATQTQATVGYDTPVGAIPNLADAGALAEFLMTGAEYPLFAKPESGSKSVGSALLTGCAGGEVTLGNGRKVSAQTLAEEIIADHPRGFILQSAVEQAEEVTRLIGPAIGTVRLVTVHDGIRARVLYALWKLPSPTAMSDNFWQDGSMLALLDAESGTITACKRGQGPDQEEMTTHPVSGLPLLGFHLPDWRAVCELGLKAHESVADLGVLGFDIAMAKGGPLIVECNSNPFHTLYQIASGRGIQTLQAMTDPVVARYAAAKAA